MTKNSIRISVGALAAAALMSALPAAAQTLDASVTATTSVSVTASSTERLTTVIARSDQEIAARLSDLNKLEARVEAMKNESAAQKADISAQVSTNIAGLTALKAKIDADTDVRTARTDEASIFGTFRIYALIVPRGYLLAAADRITVITGLMGSLSAKIETRIEADQSAGKDTAALSTTLSDMQAKIADANIQAQAAQAGVVSLAPDQGDKALLASNKAAFVAARADTKAATQDLKAARADIVAMLQGLKSLK